MCRRSHCCSALCRRRCWRAPSAPSRVSGSAAIGIGSIVAPLLIAAFDIRGALLITGALLPILANSCAGGSRQLDAAPVPERELELLRGIELFAPLPQPTQESLAQVLRPVRLAAGEELFRQGDVGDRFYIVAEGEVEIVIDGRVVRETGPGGYFGEISLLRDVPRTATVRAKGDVELFALDRDDFIAAVTGHAASAEVADSVIATRLGSIRPGMASV